MAKAKSNNPRASTKSPSRPAKTAARNVGNDADLDRVQGRSRPSASARDAAARAVAKPAGSGSGSQSKADREKADAPKPAAAEKKASTVRKVPAPTKRTTPAASSRYTPPIPKSQKVSPIWVPILMFTCLGRGMLLIILNYVNGLPGANPSNTYLMIGLGLITVGFITATKYH